MNNPFIKFVTEISTPCDCDSNLPVCLGSDIAFESDFEINEVRYVTVNGDLIKACENVQYNETNTFAQLGDDLSSVFAIGDCFRLKCGDFISNIFMYVGCRVENTLLFEYWKNGGNHLKTRLYALIYSPQPKTEKTEYETTGGNVKLLSKRRRKEYEAEFYFYPESIHDSIEEMLCYPNLTVDEVPMYESGDYEIQWDEKDEKGNARSKTKLSEQTIIKYSNC